MELSDQAAALRALHLADRPLVLPNAWDAASARLVVEHGFPVVATSSGAVAGSLGFPDDDVMPPDDAFAAVARIARSVDVPVTADVEAGYRLEPDALAARLLAAGAAGCNIEDTDHHGDAVLVPAESHAERLAAVKAAARAAGVDLVLNARVDAFVRAGELTSDVLDDGIRRARLYLDAGADCVYPITLSDERAIGELVAAVAAPVNIMLRPGAPSIARLTELGVRRISLGSGLYRSALASAARHLQQLGVELGS